MPKNHGIYLKIGANRRQGGNFGPVPPPEIPAELVKAVTTARDLRGRSVTARLSPRGSLAVGVSATIGTANHHAAVSPAARFTSPPSSSRSLFLPQSMRPVRSAGKLHDLKCRLISSDTRSPALRPDINACTLNRLCASAAKCRFARTNSRVRTLRALTLFHWHVLTPQYRGCLEPERSQRSGSFVDRHACAPQASRT